jgi:hypothetical protein
MCPFFWGTITRLSDYRDLTERIHVQIVGKELRKLL